MRRGGEPADTCDVDRIDVLLAAAVAQQERDMYYRALVASDLIVGAPRAPEYWYRRPRRGERVGAPPAVADAPVAAEADAPAAVV